MPNNCPICYEKATPSFIKGVYKYRRCVSCGTLFVINNLRSEDVYANYSKDYFEASATDDVGVRRGYPSYMEAQQSLKRSFARKLDLILDLSPNGKLLDVGAAYGTFLSLACQYYECFGIDVSNYAAQLARDQFGMNVRQGNIEQSTPFVDEFFNVVVMWDVIEHLINPVKGLKEVYRILKPGGYLVFSTDDAANWLPRLLGRNWWALAAPLHICHFTKKSVRIAIQHAGGFEQVKIVRDKREYRIGEIISHFGISFNNKNLRILGKRIDKSFLGQRVITIIRPEQFIAFVRKKELVLA